MLSIVTYCDGLECNTNGTLVEWLTIDGWGDTKHFCSWNCLTMYGSLQPWVEQVGNY